MRDRPSWERTDWVTICSAYDRLVAITDSPVVLANRALAVGFATVPPPAWPRWTRSPTIRG